MSWSASRRLIGAGSVAAVTAGLLAAASPGPSAVHWSGTASSSHVQRLTAMGSTRLAPRSQVASRNAESTNPRSHVVMTSELKIPRGAKTQRAKAPKSAATVATGNAVTDARPSGFAGLTHLDQRLSDNGDQFTVEPPDQGLCVHGGQVLETINNAFAVYGASGNRLSDITSLNEFFTKDKAIDRTDPNNLTFGKFLSDPKCLYDADTGRWFMTILEADVLPAGVNTVSHQLVAVSDSGDALGTWKIFSFATTDDGSEDTDTHDNCPCFGDQPLIGTDNHGLFITTNEFGDLGGFNGAQVYALDKHALATTGTSAVTAINAGHDIAVPQTDAGGIWYSIQPTVAPPGGSSYADGTELFASALQFGPSNFDNRIALWRMTGTDTLATNHPAVNLSVDVISSEVYGNPVPMTQRENASLRPLGKSVKEPVETVDSNDDRMNQAVFAAGRVWTGLNTMVLNGNGKQHTAVAWFSIDPDARSVVKQGYVALSQDQNVAYPSIAVNSAGKGVIGFSVMGPNLYPSTGYVRVNASGLNGPVHLNAVGAAPEDGDSGYRALGGAGDARWGDYSAAVVDDTDGSVWLGQEYIPNAPRTAFANWGTFIGHVTP